MMRKQRQIRHNQIPLSQEEVERQRKLKLANQLRKKVRHVHITMKVAVDNESKYDRAVVAKANMGKNHSIVTLQELLYYDDLFGDDDDDFIMLAELYEKKGVFAYEAFLLKRLEARRVCLERL